LRFPKRVVVNRESTIKLPEHEKIILQLLLVRLSSNTCPIGILDASILGSSTHGHISFTTTTIPLLLLLPHILNHT
jgi:hypothetical protein